jgi:hypothetical protein
MGVLNMIDHTSSHTAPNSFKVRCDLCYLPYHDHKGMWFVQKKGAQELINKIIVLDQLRQG